MEISRRQRDLWLGWAAVAALVLLVGATLWTAPGGLPSATESPVDPVSLRRPIRLQEIGPEADRELLLGLRVHHYRAQPRGEERYRDFFYDTPDWALYLEGYSYRLRVRERGGEYMVRLEREPRFSAPGEAKLDLRSDLPDTLGAAIAAGSWQLAVSQGAGLSAPESLRELLRELAIEVESVAPRLRGELLRERFDVTDKGQTWFELDSEQWTFRLTDPAAEEAAFSTRNFVLDTRLQGGHPELRRRVKTMVMMSGMFHNTRPTDLAPHEQAIRALALSAGG